MDKVKVCSKCGETFFNKKTVFILWENDYHPGLGDSDRTEMVGVFSSLEKLNKHIENSFAFTDRMSESITEIEYKKEVMHCGESTGEKYSIFFEYQIVEMDQ